ncbi:hypothetical protein GCM10020331_036930 [Ectobacillus funiculus]
MLGETAIRYVTPFQYYDSAYIIKHSAYEVSFIIVEIVFILAAAIASYIIYLKKRYPCGLMKEGLAMNVFF